ncbi:MAG: Gfo/Idh/MocA family oxidoreductase [Gammaproteobacteria bacterium]|nr:Gfo/Idh/MocA family oxidoreductase [Gammaproteobacteria bacterium]MDP2347008.1 Gfo/Idh/MocA family oxidoreductase [Gammaproteobacteria bacterium]
MTKTINIVLAGARSVRQGTGPFIAAALQKAGARIAGIVGTSSDTAELARRELAQRHHITTKGYVDLRDAIATERPDVVAICTPWQVHAEQLAIVAEAGCHCLVEKPLAWPLSTPQVDELISAFEQRGLLLHMVSQWPHTLPVFESLHGALTLPVQRFAMRLSPISIGSTMIPDAAPHLISMLQALSGPGDCEDIVVTAGHGDFPENSAIDSLILDFAYRTDIGVTQAQLQLQTCAERPRPAWYQINDLRVERELVLPEYQQYLTANGRRIGLDDPMELMATAFLTALRDGPRSQGDTGFNREQGFYGCTGTFARIHDIWRYGEPLRRGHSNLLQLADACRAALV